MFVLCSIYFIFILFVQSNTAQESEYDYIVAVRSYRTKQFLFSGIIVSRRIVLTTCSSVANFTIDGLPYVVVDVKDLTVNLGIGLIFGGPLKMVLVESVGFHRECKNWHGMLSHDLGVINLAENITIDSESAMRFTGRLEKTVTDLRSLASSGATFDVHGWSVKFNTLPTFEKANFKLYDMDACVKYFCYPVHEKCYSTDKLCGIGPSEICGNGVGSAVISDGVLWGITSRVFNPCSQATISIVTFFNSAEIDEMINNAIKSFHTTPFETIV
ncbi:uncharacterized protein LOC106663789 [Cimex lectularius]|uniref:Peptidase S1 domain-containing protein n=1 Tax=Cimex lectularius TaxID=79782 RepID=A0A8I6RE16_CIMLE|nr:uncharacterized protein LOC106663789 [Cimex lectularius]